MIGGIHTGLEVAAIALLTDAVSAMADHFVHDEYYNGPNPNPSIKSKSIIHTRYYTTALLMTIS